MRIMRQINKQNKAIAIEKIHDKQQARYAKIREEVKDLTKEELQKLLISKQHSKLDRMAIIHTIKKIDDSNRNQDIVTEYKSKENESSTHNNNALSGEDTNSQQEIS